MDAWFDENLLRFLWFGDEITIEFSAKEARRVKSRAESYVWRENGLYYKDRVVPKPEERVGIVKKVHETLGHPCALRTLNSVAEKYFWREMKNSVFAMVKSCCACQVARAPKATFKPVMVQELAEGPWISVAVDLCELPWQTLPNALKDSSMARYILVTVCRFSKWIELIPLKTKSSAEIAKKFESQILMRLGRPLKISSDNGKEFEGEFASLLKRWEIERTYARAYHPQGNGLAEAAVATVKKRLYAKLIETKLIVPWEELLPNVQYSYNICPHTSTKIAPFSLMYGRSHTGEAIERAELQNCGILNNWEALEKQRRGYMKRLKKRFEEKPVVAGDSILWTRSHSLKRKRILGPYSVMGMSGDGLKLRVLINGVEESIPKEEASIFYP